MGTTIFAENFRGFAKLSLNIDDNIFLVGDNSSGKTSILHLADYIVGSELKGRPELDDNLHVDRHDFFSPYFNYADVLVGFNIVKDNGDNFTRIITLNKDKSDGWARVIRCTYSSNNFILSLKDRRGKRSAIFRRLDEPMSIEEVISVHKATAGFKDLKISTSAALNEPTVSLRALSKLDRELIDGESKPAERTADLLLGTLLPNARHIGALRGQPEKFYQYDRRFKASGSHFASMMHDITGQAAVDARERAKRFGKESGLFDDFYAKRIGRSVDGPLHIEVVRNGKHFLINQVGVGVSQVAPIIAESLASVSGMHVAKTFLLQQPELHLHPVAQAALGEYLFELSEIGLTFLIETHSDYLIDRFRSLVRDKDGQRNSSLLYCYSDGEGNHTINIAINSDGALVDPPDRYFAFFINEIARTML